MADITQIIRFDDLASQDSPIHNLEGRIKLISTIFIIVTCVVSNEIFMPIILEVFLLIILKIAKLSYKDSFKRLLMLLPFGGAVIILESLKNKRKVIVCVNDELMDNHQIELASSLHENGYVYYCKNLSDIIQDCEKVIDKSITLKEYPEFNYDIIPNAIYSTLNI